MELAAGSTETLGLFSDASKVPGPYREPSPALWSWLYWWAETRSPEQPSDSTTSKRYEGAQKNNRELGQENERARTQTELDKDTQRNRPEGMDTWINKVRISIDSMLSTCVCVFFPHYSARFHSGSSSISCCSVPHPSFVHFWSSVL